MHNSQTHKQFSSSIKFREVYRQCLLILHLDFVNSNNSLVKTNPVSQIALFSMYVTHIFKQLPPVVLPSYSLQ